MRKIISGYTREAGLRRLERAIGGVTRKVALKFAEGSTGPFTVKLAELEEMLGPEPFNQEEARRDLPPGVATGLAWTETGGDVLYIEGTLLPDGKGLTLTGQLGEVMQESVKAAQSYIWSRTRGRYSSTSTRRCSKTPACTYTFPRARSRRMDRRPV